jgi:hypothetical protein
MSEKIQMLHYVPISIILYSKMKYPSTGQDFCKGKCVFILFHDAKESMQLQHAEMA